MRSVPNYCGACLRRYTVLLRSCNTLVSLRAMHLSIRASFHAAYTLTTLCKGLIALIGWILISSACTRDTRFMQAEATPSLDLRQAPQSKVLGNAIVIPDQDEDMPPFVIEDLKAWMQPRPYPGAIQTDPSQSNRLKEFNSAGENVRVLRNVNGEWILYIIPPDHNIPQRLSRAIIAAGMEIQGTDFNQHQIVIYQPDQEKTITLHYYLGQQAAYVRPLVADDETETLLTIMRDHFASSKGS